MIQEEFDPSLNVAFFISLYPLGENAKAINERRRPGE